MYADDELDEDARPADGAASIAAASSVACTPSGPVRSDLDSMMDEFLGSYSMTTGKNKKRLRRVGNQTGLEQLDEIVGSLLLYLLLFFHLSNFFFPKTYRKHDNGGLISYTDEPCYGTASRSWTCSYSLIVKSLTYLVMYVVQ